MKRLAYLALIHACSLGCLAIDTPRATDGGNGMDQKCPPDLATPSPPAKCAAAKGLAGENIYCIDFSTLPNQPLGDVPPSALPNWDFSTSCGGKFWEINGGKLQIQNFRDFDKMCGFLMPLINLNQAPYSKYNAITISLIQRVDINNPQHIALGALGSAVPTRTFWTATGKSERQQLTVTLPKTDPVPKDAGGIYQFLFQISSTVRAGDTAQGWQIESIAVMGNS